MSNNFGDIAEKPKLFKVLLVLWIFVSLVFALLYFDVIHFRQNEKVASAVSPSNSESSYYMLAVQMDEVSKQDAIDECNALLDEYRKNTQQVHAVAYFEKNMPVVTHTCEEFYDWLSTHSDSK